MPIHEYCNKDRSDCEDHLFLVGDDIPQTVNGKSRVISAPTVKFVGSFSGGTAQRHILQGAIEKKTGQKVVEAGMDKDVKRHAQERTAKADTVRRKHIETALESYSV